MSRYSYLIENEKAPNEKTLQEKKRTVLPALLFSYSGTRDGAADVHGQCTRSALLICLRRIGARLGPRLLFSTNRISAWRPTSMHHEHGTSPKNAPKRQFEGLSKRLGNDDPASNNHWVVPTEHISDNLPSSWSSQPYCGAKP